jgi:transcriptional regulator with XRE-family HTH domain
MRRPAQSTEQVAATLQGLVRLRQAAGVNQTTLAARLGITQSEVSKFERGERALDERRLRAWLCALDVEWTSFTRALGQATVPPFDATHTAVPRDAAAPERWATRQYS